MKKRSPYRTYYAAESPLSDTLLISKDKGGYGPFKGLGEVARFLVKHHRDTLGRWGTLSKSDADNLSALIKLEVQRQRVLARGRPR